MRLAAILLAAALIAGGAAGVLLVTGDDADGEAVRRPPATQPRPEAPSAKPPEAPQLACPPEIAGCRSVSGRVVFVESVDPDGDGDLHVVIAGGGVTLPGLTAIDIRRGLRPARDPRIRRHGGGGRPRPPRLLPPAPGGGDRVPSRAAVAGWTGPRCSTTPTAASATGRCAACWPGIAAAGSGRSRSRIPRRTGCSPRWVRRPGWPPGTWSTPTAGSTRPGGLRSAVQAAAWRQAAGRAGRRGAEDDRPPLRLGGRQARHSWAGGCTCDPAHQAA